MGPASLPCDLGLYRHNCRFTQHLKRTALLAACLAPLTLAQQSFTWQEIKDKFEAGNPSLQAARISVDESKAQKTTATLRPNPGVTATIDQLDPFTPNPYRPLANTLPLVSGTYLHERQNK